MENPDNVNNACLQQEVSKLKSNCSHHRHLFSGNNLSYHVKTQTAQNKQSVTSKSIAVSSGTKKRAHKNPKGNYGRPISVLRIKTSTHLASGLTSHVSQPYVSTNMSGFSASVVLPNIKHLTLFLEAKYTYFKTS